MIRHLRDMCGQLVGALGFVIYLLDESGETLIPIANEGLEGSHVVPIPDRYGNVESSGLTYTVERGEHTHDINLTP